MTKASTTAARKILTIYAERAAALAGGTLRDIRLRSRRKCVVAIRRRAVAIMTHLDHMSSTDIADALGYRDHTTVLYHLREQNKMIGFDGDASTLDPIERAWWIAASESHARMGQAKPCATCNGTGMSFAEASA